MGEQGRGVALHGAGDQLPQSPAVRELRRGHGAHLHATTVRLQTHVRDHEVRTLSTIKTNSEIFGIGL